MLIYFVSILFGGLPLAVRVFLMLSPQPVAEDTIRAGLHLHIPDYDLTQFSRLAPSKDHPRDMAVEALSCQAGFQPGTSSIRAW